MRYHIRKQLGKLFQTKEQKKIAKETEERVESYFNKIDEIPTMHFQPPERQTTVFEREKDKVWFTKIKIFEQEDYVKGHSTRDGMINMELSINKYIKKLDINPKTRLVKITPSYGATDDANFHMIYTVEFMVQINKPEEI